MCECPADKKFVVTYEGRHKKVCNAVVCVNCDTTREWKNWQTLKHRVFK